MKRKITTGLIIALLLLLGPIAYGQYNAISVNFPGQNTVKLKPGDVAGVVPMSNWNNGVNNNSVDSLVDNFGVMYPIATITNNLQSNYVNAQNSVTFKVVNGEIDSIKVGTVYKHISVSSDFSMMYGLLGTWESAVKTITVSGLPDFITVNGFKLYVYFQNSDQGGTHLNKKFSFNVGTTTYVLRDTKASWDSVWIKAPTADSIANYMIFEGLTGDNVTLNVQNLAGGRAGVAGLQVIGNAVPISNLVGISGPKKAKLTFPKLLKFSSVKVMKKAAGDANFTEVAAADLSKVIGPQDEDVTVLHLTDGVEYSFKLDVAGSPYTGESNVVKVTPISTPVNDLAGKEWGVGMVKLTWSPATGATTVTLQKSMNGTDWANVDGITLTQTSDSVILSGLTDGTKHYFRLDVIGGGNEGTSNVVEVVPGKLNVNLNVTPGEKTVTIKFDQPISSTGIKLFKKVDAGTYSEVTGVTLLPAGTVLNDLARGIYSFKLTVTGGPSEGDFVVENMVVSSPITDLAATAGDAEVTLAFTAPAGATEAKLYYKLSTDLDFVNSVNVAATDASKKVTGLTNQKGYDFKLVVTGGIYAGTSNTVSATPLAVVNVSIRSISVNLMGDTLSPGFTGKYVIQPNESAGAFPAKNWLNVMWNNATRATDQWFLINEKGEETGAYVTFPWFHVNYWAYSNDFIEGQPVSYIEPTNADDKLLYGITKRYNGVGTCQVYNLPESMTTGEGYDVICYFNAAWTAADAHKVQFLFTEKDRNTNPVTHDTLSIADTDPFWSGEYTESKTVHFADAVADGSTYVRFRNMHYKDFFINVIIPDYESRAEKVGAGGINGFQIINNNPTSVVNPGENHSLNVFPTLAKDFVRISIDGTVSAGAYVEFINSIGATVLKSNINESFTELNVSKLTEGLYFVKLTNGKSINVAKIRKY